MNGRIIFRILILVLNFQGWFGFKVPVRAETTKPVAMHQQLAFLQGTWTGKTEKGAYVEEYWSRPAGDTMIGHCRFIADGKTTFYELLAIVWEPDRVVLKMRHFDKDFLGWDESAEAGDCVLVSCTSSEVLFENSNSQHKVRVSYRKLDRRDEAIQTIVEDTRDGQTRRYPFEYHRL
jgi:hypothetical protein